MNERLKKLRLLLNMSQEEFGLKIGIKSRAHISSLESGTRNITDRVINDVCSTYNANEEWLRHGTGKMIIEPAVFSLDEYATKNDLNEKEIVLIRSFMELDPSIRNALYDVFKKAFDSEPVEEKKSLYEEFPKNPEELERLYPPVEENNKHTG